MTFKVPANLNSFMTVICRPDGYCHIFKTSLTHLDTKGLQYWYIKGFCYQNIWFNATMQSFAGDT